MPEQETLEKAREDARQGKSASTQAGEFVREEMHHVREGKHGARSTKQAIAIGLSKARRAGVKLPAPGKGKTTARTRAQAERDVSKGAGATRKKPSATRSRATQRALKREGYEAASPEALARQARRSGRARGPAARREAASKAVQSKGREGLQVAARKAARTRAES
ncbi:MAG: DUF6496 domain-containing protein [Terriglobia bacterium]